MKHSSRLAIQQRDILALRSDHEPKGTTTTFYTYEQFSGIQSLGNGNAPCRHESSECQPYAVE